MNAPDKAVAFEALMKDTPGFDHYDSGYDGILPEAWNCRFHRLLWKYQSCVFEEPILHYQTVHKEGDVQMR